MKKSLFASVAVLALVLASPALAQRDDRDNTDENAPRARHVPSDTNNASDNDTDKNKPREENRERPPPSSTVSPSGTMGTERGTRHERGTGNTTEPSGTMGTERGTRHERGTGSAMRPGGTTAVRPNIRGGTMAAPTGRIGGGPHVHNPKFTSMRRAFTASRRFQVGAYVRPSGFYVHHWTFGEFLPVFFFADSTYWILDWGDFYLEAPPPGTIWVRVGDDALLIDQFTGEVIIVEYGIFY